MRGPASSPRLDPGAHSPDLRLIEPGKADRGYAIFDVGLEVGFENRMGVCLDQPRNDRLAGQLPMLDTRRHQAVGPLARVNDAATLDHHH